MSKKRSFSPVPGGAVAASQQMAVQQIAFAGKFSVLARPKGLGFAHHEEIRGAAHGPPVSPVPPVRPADSPPARGPARGLSSLKTCRRHVLFTLRSEVRVPSLNKKTGSSLLRTSCFGAPEGTRTPDLLIRSQFFSLVIAGKPRCNLILSHCIFPDCVLVTNTVTNKTMILSCAKISQAAGLPL